MIPLSGLTTTGKSAFTILCWVRVSSRKVSFNPERWDEPTQEMRDSYMPFGGAARGELFPIHAGPLGVLMSASSLYRPKCRTSGNAPRRGHPVPRDPQHQAR